MINDLQVLCANMGINSNSLNNSIRLLTDKNPNNDKAVYGQLTVFINQINTNKMNVSTKD